MERPYSRVRVLVMLAIILVLIMADHLSSPTFAFNSGQGNVETALSQQAPLAGRPVPQHETDH